MIKLPAIIFILTFILVFSGCASTKESSNQQSPEEIARLIDELGLDKNEKPASQSETRDNPSESLLLRLRQLSGVSIVDASGEYYVRLRGVNSISNASQAYAVFVVNGAKVAREYSAVESLVNVEDIADIRIMKSEDSYMRYGLDAAFGAVLITTK